MPFENWETDQHLNRKTLIAILLIAVVSCAGVAVAVIKIYSPPSDPVTVQGPPTLNQPTLNGTSLYTGETLQLTVTISSLTEGIQVFFYENDSNIGSAITNSAGEAILNHQMNTVGTYIYTASAIVN